MRKRQPRATTPRDRLIGAHVRRRRHELGVSMLQLAETLGVTYQQLQKYEGGVDRISAARLCQCAEALNTPIAYFLEGALPSKLLAASYRKKGMRDVEGLSAEQGEANIVQSSPRLG